MGNIFSDISAGLTSGPQGPIVLGIGLLVALFGAFRAYQQYSHPAVAGETAKMIIKGYLKWLAMLAVFTVLAAYIADAVDPDSPILGWLIVLSPALFLMGMDLRTGMFLKPSFMF